LAFDKLAILSQLSTVRIISWAQVSWTHKRKSWTERTNQNRGPSAQAGIWCVLSAPQEKLVDFAG